MADMKTLAKGKGGLELAGTPEGFDALVVADILKARGGTRCMAAAAVVITRRGAVDSADSCDSTAIRWAASPAEGLTRS